MEPDDASAVLIAFDRVFLMLQVVIAIAAIAGWFALLTAGLLASRALK